MPGNSIVPATVLPSAAFVEEVRAALDHLFDYTVLHNHPLTWRLCDESGIDGVTRAQRVRAALLNAIEQLRPIPRAGSPPGDETRVYALLTFRCLDGLTMDEIAAKLGLSRRQAYREYARAVDAVAGLIWDLLPGDAASFVQPSASPGSVLDPTIASLSAIAASSSTAVERAGEQSRMDVATEEVARLTQTLQLEQVNLSVVVYEVAELLAPRLQQTGAELQIGKNAPQPTVLADRALLRQALLNVMSYALDQACAGGAVEICWELADRTTILWVAACRSTAEPLARREGVGVSVAQKLVEAMGGQTRIAPGHDAWRCTFLLPTAERDTVLVVDDNADLTALFQRYAAGHNIDVVGARNGVQALELARELRPQLIILDLMLPQVDGWEILQRLRRSEETSATPIVICSVLNEPDLAFSLGASDYVTKPINQATLVDVLRRWLGKLPPAV